MAALGRPFRAFGPSSSVARAMCHQPSLSFTTLQLLHKIDGLGAHSAHAPAQNRVLWSCKTFCSFKYLDFVLGLNNITPTPSFIFLK